MSDTYVQSIINKHKLDYLDAGIIERTANQLLPYINGWGGNYILEVRYSGSYAKSTGVKGSSDMDLFISLSSNTQETLQQIHATLCNYLLKNNILAKPQNVSIGLKYNGLSIDLTPGKKQSGNTNDHSIYSNKRRTWQLTNIDEHISHVQRSGRIDEIKATKIWRNLHQLDFPSFYLEMTVIEALRGRYTNQLATNFLTVLGYIRDRLQSAVITDPANSSNRVSDDLTPQEKNRVAYAAQVSRAKPTWGEILW